MWGEGGGGLCEGWVCTKDLWTYVFCLIVLRSFSINSAHLHADLHKIHLKLSSIQYWFLCKLWSVWLDFLNQALTKFSSLFVSSETWPNINNVMLWIWEEAKNERFLVVLWPRVTSIFPLSRSVYLLGFGEKKPEPPPRRKFLVLWEVVRHLWAGIATCQRTAILGVN